MSYFPNKSVRYLLKNEKGKWFSSDANNKHFNLSGFLFTSNKARAHNFQDKHNADYWAEKLQCHFGYDKVTVVEEKV